ncbi:DUF4294 domain-containing protein [Flavobacterium supellecticarium]|uniref:DUF4294 domain-containing protein n=1 Tax=Flavobacterium supellecticarium TaxID=2565924 RepID=A0A4S3ZQW6_9FLAO|nr:DUF4294 domain-containing protein [Flavobacterium supellecticarium]THF47971.1 DUF4294 domain-containing protein [Flavobacterium supellecticarium]
MKHLFILSGFLFFPAFFYAQVNPQDTLKTELPNTVKDTSVSYMIQMDEVIVGKNTAYAEEMKKIRILERRVLKVYPYAKVAAENLTILNANMAKLSSDREKKKYFKIVENYLQNEFEDRLKKFSRKDGQILVKLIHRQTGVTTFELIKDLKSGWKAFWSNNTARLFDINLKKEYKPFDDLEDFYIESILIKSFKSGKLQKQDPATPIDLAELAATWRLKAEKSKQIRSEREAKAKEEVQN